MTCTLLADPELKGISKNSLSGRVERLFGFNSHNGHYAIRCCIGEAVLDLNRALFSGHNNVCFALSNQPVGQTSPTPK